MDKLVAIDCLTKVFTLGSLLSRIRITAVDNVSFTIEPAEIFALAGESGCGKTTTARMILGFEEPTSGAIIYKGKVGQKNERVWFTEGVQAIFQDPFKTFNPLRTVDSYFFETLKNYKLAATEADAIRRIDEKLHAVGLSYEEFAGRYPSEFSGGQLQRATEGDPHVTAGLIGFEAQRIHDLACCGHFLAAAFAARLNSRTLVSDSASTMSATERHEPAVP